MSIRLDEKWPLRFREQFSSLYDDEGPEKCWIWRGQVTPNKNYLYPVFYMQGELYNAKHIVYSIYYPLPEIPPDKTYRLYRKSTCSSQNSLCVNPHHFDPPTISNKRPQQTHCKNGHDLTRVGARIAAGRCRMCRKDYKKKSYEKKRNAKTTPKRDWTEVATEKLREFRRQGNA